VKLLEKLEKTRVLFTKSPAWHESLEAGHRTDDDCRATSMRETGR
jgi:hypothetical protein